MAILTEKQFIDLLECVAIDALHQRVDKVREQSGKLIDHNRAMSAIVRQHKSTGLAVCEADLVDEVVVENGPDGAEAAVVKPWTVRSWIESLNKFDLDTDVLVRMTNDESGDEMLATKPVFAMDIGCDDVEYLSVLLMDEDKGIEDVEAQAEEPQR